MRATSFLYFLLAASMLLFSCKKETDGFTADMVAPYAPVKTGKTITYRLDSTVFTNFGRNTEIHSYLERHDFDTEFIDNLGRRSFRVFRFINDTTGNGPWVPSGTYVITVLPHAVETSENNLRILRLAAPVKDDFSWKGNRYLPSDPYGGLFSFSNDDFMADWEFTYSGKDETLQLKNHLLDSVISVTHVDESINVPITSPTAYASINYAVDKYAKGIGLVFQELIMWEYQPNPSGPSGYSTGFGVKRSMIDHN